MGEASNIISTNRISPTVGCASAVETEPVTVRVTKRPPQHRTTARRSAARGTGCARRKPHRHELRGWFVPPTEAPPDTRARNGGSTVSVPMPLPLSVTSAVMTLSSPPMASLSPSISVVLACPPPALICTDRPGRRRGVHRRRAAHRPARARVDQVVAGEAVRPTAQLGHPGLDHAALGIGEPFQPQRERPARARQLHHLRSARQRRGGTGARWAPCQTASRCRGQPA